VPTSSPADRDRAFELIKRYGWNATSFQCLEPGMQYWFPGDGLACVAYADTGSAWVAAGAPITAPERLVEVACRFCEEARRRGKRVAFFATERRFTSGEALASSPIGEQPVWDPGRWPEILAASRGLREQLRRARARGVTVRPLSPEQLCRPGPDRAAIEGLVREWVRRRSMAVMGFLVQVDLFSYAEERRTFVAEEDGRIIGFLSMVPVFSRGGWLVEDLLRDPHAPNGTSELLIDAAMRSAADAGSRYVTLGLAPLSGRVSRPLRLARSFGARLYNFQGLRAFRSRLRPERWEPIYLSYPRGQPRLLTVLDVLSAFAPGGLARFGIETFARSPALPLYVLAGLLVPWTAALALVPTRPWFPYPWVQQAWTVFDLFLLTALFSLARRWNDRLALLLASLVTADALLTAVEVLRFNLPHARTALEWTVALVAVAGPSLGAAFLWTTRRLRGAVLSG
jgi:phosphatidylglycerol lysyltransferase